MRDSNNNLLNNCTAYAGHQKILLSKDTVYKEVVVIGNGPSGISLSLMLSGNWPYWSKEKVQSHPDELLRARLNHANSEKSIVEQDLVSLADGLEGRSTNPVSLLLDNLNHPCADLGIENIPSMLYFQYHPEKEINHIVLGKGPAGGSWHRMDPHLRTLSLAAWMSLPGLDFLTWDQRESKPSNEVQTMDNAPAQPIIVNEKRSKRGAGAVKKGEVQTRALISRVAEYYKNYVTEMNLEKNFWNDVSVTNILPIRIINTHNSLFKAARWLVIGTRNNKSLQIVCKNVVLANGSSDLANRLGLPAENIPIPWLKHELPQLEAALSTISRENRKHLKPVLIVGAGLSAADAITICRSNNIPVIHVYRNRTAGLDKMLPENVYPEYHRVHKMMKDTNNSYENYTPVPEHVIADLDNSSSAGGVHKVVLRHIKTGELKSVEVSYCAVLIGSRPDLRFLNHLAVSQQCGQNHHNPRLIENLTHPKPHSLIVECVIDEENSPDDLPPKFSLIAKQLSWFKKILCEKCRHINFCERIRLRDYKRISGSNFGRCTCPNNLTPGVPTAPEMVNKSAMNKIEEVLGIGEDPTKPIDGKNNPISVDKFTNRVLRAPKGLYAMGPLVGDNFVRFIPGGALAITSALHREND